MHAPLKRYGRLWWFFVRNNLARELEFRGNFWGGFFMNLAWLGSFVLFLKIFFANTQSLGGWDEPHTFLLFGTFLLSRSLTDIIFTPNLSKIPELVRLGTMDFVLTKPVSSLFNVSLRYLSFDELGSLFGAFAILAYGVHLVGTIPSAGQIGDWLVLTFCGVAILYAVQLALMTLSFWFVRLENLSALVDSVVYLGRYPADIFPTFLRLLLTYLVPLAFVAYVPVLALKEGVSASWLFVALGMATLFVLLAAGFWRYATSVYTSASS